MGSITVKPTEENTASRLVYHSWRTRFAETEGGQVVYYSPGEGLNFLDSQNEDEPVHVSKVNLPLPGGQYCIILEEFIDGSWAVFFEEFPSIIGGSNDSWEDALDDLAEIVSDDLQDIKKYKDNVSLYQKKRHKFLKKVFNL